MRFPVFARGSNPAIDREILRKSKSYIENEVKAGRADWVDPADPRKGILCRETLYFGPRAPRPDAPIAEVATAGRLIAGLAPLEIPGVRFMDPHPSRNLAAFQALRTRWEYFERQAATALAG